MVKNILLIRHAEAQFPDSETKDFERHLTNNGEKQATLLGMHINDLSLEFDAVYFSPANRTIETKNILKSQLAYSPQELLAEELYEATINLMKAFIGRLDESFNNAMIVGHNPAIARLFTHFAFDVKDFTPATCALLSFEADSWAMLSANMGTEQDYYYPGMR